MSSKRTYYLMIASLVVLVAAILGGSYMANQQLQAQSDKLAVYKSKHQVLTEEQLGLIKAKKDVATYSQLEKISKTIVPQDKDQAQAVREIVNIASEAGIRPTAINFPVSTLGSALGTGTTSGAAGPATPVAGGSAQKSLSQLTPVKGIPGVYNLQITIQLDATSAVPYTQFLDFVSRLEQNRRTAQVTSIVLQPSAVNRSLVSFTLTVDEFIKP
jgi:hypothetical protein